jgi:hypothetical protein
MVALDVFGRDCSLFGIFPIFGRCPSQLLTRRGELARQLGVVGLVVADEEGAVPVGDDVAGYVHGCFPIEKGKERMLVGCPF